MRCLHCGKRLSLLRKLSDAEFCSAEHRQEFQQQQSDLALARLIESQNRIDRPRTPQVAKPPRNQRKAEAEPVFPMAQPAREHISAVATPHLHKPEAQLETRAQEAGLPMAEVPIAAKGFPAPGPIPFAPPLALNSSSLCHASASALFQLTVQLPRYAAPAFSTEPRNSTELRTASSLFALSFALQAPQPGAILAAAAAVAVPDPLTRIPASGLELARIQFSPVAEEHASAPTGDAIAVASSDWLEGVEGVEDDLSWPLWDAQEVLPLRALDAGIPLWLPKPQPDFSDCSVGSGRQPELASLIRREGASRLAPNPRVCPSDAMKPLQLQALTVAALTSTPAQHPISAALDAQQPALCVHLTRVELPGTRNPVLQPVATPAASTGAHSAACGAATFLLSVTAGLPAPPMLGQPSLRPVRRAARIPVKAVAAAAGAGMPNACPEPPSMERVLPFFHASTPTASLPTPEQHPLVLSAHCLHAPWINSQPVVALAISASDDPACPGMALRPVPPVGQDPEPVAEPVRAGRRRCPPRRVPNPNRLKPCRPCKT